MRISYPSFYIAWILVLCLSGNSQAQNQGEVTFKQICAACHTVGKGRLVGPDLMNIHQRRTDDWLLRFIKSSQTVIKGGDAYADSLFKAYNQVMMPDQTALSEAQMKEVLAYIQATSTEGAASVSPGGAGPDVLAVTGDVQRVGAAQLLPVGLPVGADVLAQRSFLGHGEDAALTDIKAVKFAE